MKNTIITLASVAAFASAANAQSFWNWSGNVATAADGRTATLSYTGSGSETYLDDVHNQSGTYAGPGASAADVDTRWVLDNGSSGNYTISFAGGNLNGGEFFSLWSADSGDILAIKLRDSAGSEYTESSLNTLLTTGARDVYPDDTTVLPSWSVSSDGSNVINYIGSSDTSQQPLWFLSSSMPISQIEIAASNTLFTGFGISSSVDNVPEPSSTALLGLGALGLLARRKR